jgi:hypothetical protein
MSMNRPGPRSDRRSFRTEGTPHGFATARRTAITA